MKSYEQLDSVLKFLSTYSESMTLTAPEICEKSGLTIDKHIAGLIVDKLNDDGCVRRMDCEVSRYQPKFKAKLFLDNGGYSHQHTVYKREFLSKKISHYTNMVIKPFAVISSAVTITILIFKLYNFLF